MDPPAVVAGLHLPSGLGHVTERSGHAAGQPSGQPERDGGRDGPGDEQLPPEVAQEPEGRAKHAGGVAGCVYRLGGLSRLLHRYRCILDPARHADVNPTIVERRRRGSLRPVPRERALPEAHHGYPAGDVAEVGRRGARRHPSEAAQVGFPERVSKRESQEEIDQDDRHAHGEHDRRAELGPDRGELLERSHGASAGSRNA